MKRLTLFVLVLVGISVYSTPAEAVTCTPTGFFRDSINMTAAYINPPGTFSSTVGATGCNIVVYYDHTGAGGTVKNADLSWANYFGVLVNGDAGAVNVDILGSKIHDIGEPLHNGTQHGVGIYYRAFFIAGAATGRVAGNEIYDYQKGGLVVNGQGSQVNVVDNVVTGDGPVTFIAQNGIQIGFGASASVMRNNASNNSYIGFPGDGSASGGVLVVGGPGYGNCPDGSPCPFTVNVKVNDSVLTNNDVGVYLSNL